MESIEKWLAANRHFGIFFLRLFVGLRLLYGVVDNVLSWEKMLEFSAFLESNDFPVPLICAVTSVYVQFIGSLLILLGYKIRLASFVLVINFLVALLLHIRAGDSIEGMTPALAMLFGSLTFMFTGAGKIALEKEFTDEKR